MVNRSSAEGGVETMAIKHGFRTDTVKPKVKGSLLMIDWK